MKKQNWLYVVIVLVLLVLGYYQATKPIPHPDVTGGTLILLEPNERPLVEYKLAGLKDESGLTYVTTTRKSFTVGDRAMKVIYTNGREVIYPEAPAFR